MAQLPNWETHMTSKGRITAVAALVALLSTFLVIPSAQAASSTCWDYRTAERGFARRINTERTDRNLGKLRLDPEASKAARVHTNEMIRNDELYHTPSTTLGRRVTNWIVLGENVGVGGSVGSLHEAFMNSEGHRDNVLYPTYRHVGIGTRHAHGRLWVTIIFEAVTDPGTSLKMPSCR
jgi:uncharacterized protein YkwD